MAPVLPARGAGTGSGFWGYDAGNKMSEFNLISSKLFTGSDAINTHSFFFFTQGWKTPDYRTSSSPSAGKPWELIDLIFPWELIDLVFTKSSESSCEGHPGNAKPWHAVSTPAMHYPTAVHNQAPNLPGALCSSGPNKEMGAELKVSSHLVDLSGFASCP